MARGSVDEDTLNSAIDLALMAAEEEKGEPLDAFEVEDALTLQPNPLRRLSHGR